MCSAPVKGEPKQIKFRNGEFKPEDGRDPLRRIEDERVLIAVEDAGLAMALQSHINDRQRLLLSLGEKAVSAADIGPRVTKGWSDKAYKKIIVDWVQKQVSHMLEEYLSKEQNNIGTLLEELMPLVPYWSGVAGPPEGIERLAKLFLACCFDERAVELAESLLLFKASREEDDDDDMSELTIAVMEDPESEEAEKASGTSPLFMLVRVVCAVRFGHWELYDRIKKEAKLRRNLPFDWDTFEKELEAHAAEVRPTGEMPAQKLRMAKEGEFQSISGIEVLTVCSKHVPESVSENPYAFSRIMAVKRASAAEWLEITPAEAKKLFPKTGSIVHFPGKRYPPLPKKGEYAVWKVEEQKHDSIGEAQEKENFTLIRASARVMPAQQVRSFESVSSENVEGVKQMLREVDTGLGLDEVVRLSDGLYVKPPVDVDGFLQGKEKEPLAAWTELKAIQFSSGLNLHVGELPDTSRSFDLSDGYDVILKSLRQSLILDAQRESKFGEVLETLGNDSSLERTVGEMHLDGLEWRSSGFRNLETQLVGNPEVERMLQERGKAEVDSKQENNATVEDRINSIEEEMRKIDKRAEDALESMKSFRSEVDALIVRHFSKVRQLGRRLAKFGQEDRKDLYPEITEQVNRMMEMNYEVEKAFEEMNNLRRKSKKKGK